MDAQQPLPKGHLRKRLAFFIRVGSREKQQAQEGKTMKKGILIGFVVLALGVPATTARAHGMGGFGGFHGGFHGGMGGFRGGFGGFRGGFTQPGFHRGFVHPGFQGFGHFDQFQNEQFFGFHRHFDRFHRGFPGGFFFGRPFFPFSPRAVVISTPFFCFPDGLGFTDQALFFDHLHQAHGIPPDRALSFSTPLLGGRRFIFFGF